MTLREAFEAYRMDVIIFGNQSRKTEENHQIVQRNIQNFFGDIAIESLDFNSVRDWKLELDKARSPETVRNYIIKLRVVLAFLLKRGYQVLDPDLIPVPKRSDKVPSFISREEVSKLIGSFNVPRSNLLNRVRNQAILSMLYATGIRVSELCSLDKAMIHDKTFTILGKGGKARLCFFDDRAEGFLHEYLKLRLDTSPALFMSKSGKRITPGTVQTVFRYASKRTGIFAHPHTMRHSYATDLLRNNCNMRYVQTLLGHASLETTQMYTHVVDQDLAKVYAQFHLI